MVVLLDALLLLLVREVQRLLLDLEVAIGRVELVRARQGARLEMDDVVEYVFRLRGAWGRGNKQRRLGVINKSSSYLPNGIMKSIGGCVQIGACF